MKKIHFQSEGQIVRGALYTPEDIKKKNPGVIFFHGMTSSADRYAQIAIETAQKGIVALTISLRAHGESEGDFDKITVNNAVRDGFAAYDFFKKFDFVDRARIGICGASFGAAIAASVSGKKTVKSLVLRAPAAYSSSMMGWTFKEIMAHEGKLFHTLSDIEEAPSVKAIEKFNGSLLVVLSEKDVIIPKSIPEAYLSAASKVKEKRKVVIKSATHNLSENRWREEFIEESVDWFSNTL